MNEIKLYKVNDIFYSLQGEGANAGRAAVFVRFAMCNLSCPFCDTDFADYNDMSSHEIAEECKRISQNQPSMVILTGGEPTLQTDEELVRALKEAGFTLAIETNGTQKVADGIDWITCSPKSGNVVLKRANEVKVVYLGQDVEKYREQIQADYYFLQPCSCENTEQVVDYIKSHPHWRLSVQIQKYIGIK